MPMFVVKRQLTGITPDALQGAGLRIKTCAAEMQIEGCDVHWVRSYFLPEAAQTHCYFNAPDTEILKQLNDRAQIPFVDIAEVEEMTPEMV